MAPPGRTLQLTKHGAPCLVDDIKADRARPAAKNKTGKLPVLCAQLLLVALGAKRLQLSPG
jgi:hypothetical protein